MGPAHELCAVATSLSIPQTGLHNCACTFHLDCMTHLATKVKAYLNSGAFAAQQAARKARGGRGIIINAGGPQLLSSALVAIQVSLTTAAGLALTGLEMRQGTCLCLQVLHAVKPHQGG